MVGLALTAAVFALVIAKDAPGMSFALTLTAGLLILRFAVQSAGQIMDTLSGVLAIANIGSGLYLPVLKAVGIAAIIRIAAALCQDAGQSSLAAKLEIAGTLAAIIVTLPLFTQVLDMVGTMLT